ncbi:mannose-6-phosphate isomerase, class I [Gryllotalpicola ginsengisoli]|uniref:mannose-6-phosphate isomerase, class I n=1 Tax=Gryllotalpicola ginsengisoli TaxID=444608 RepID=UPI0003B63C73|nr:mannose-6-phosphate isomerase, class I [Gryllotalpicola ginsengisoli]
MFVRIDNTPRDYPWGSTTAIAGLRGLAPSGAPEAELWLGAHPGSPARLVDPVPGASDLAAWIRAEPERALGPALADADRRAGREPHLPFLLKVLAARSPLSLQAHPSPEQAAAGFERENAAGVPLDAPHRNYKDPFHKPEIIVALSETFDALCGFRPRAQAVSDVAALVSAAQESGEPSAALGAFQGRLAQPADEVEALRDAVAWLLAGGGDVAALVAEAVHAARLLLAERGADDFREVDALDPALWHFATVITLDDAFPGDPGVVLSLLLNQVRLTRGQALYLPAGNIHAYLRGLGIELMAASDNVLRGGLTPKHVDVPELLRVLEFTPLPAPLLEPAPLGDGARLFRPDVPDFQLVHVVRETDAPAVRLPFELAAPAVAFAAAGRLTLTGATGSHLLERGQAVYITPEEGALGIAGAGELFLATAGAVLQGA